MPHMKKRLPPMLSSRDLRALRARPPVIGGTAQREDALKKRGSIRKRPVAGNLRDRVGIGGTAQREDVLKKRGPIRKRPVSSPRNRRPSVGLGGSKAGPWGVDQGESSFKVVKPKPKAKVMPKAKPKDMQTSRDLRALVERSFKDLINDLAKPRPSSPRRAKPRPSSPRRAKPKAKRKESAKNRK
jgi:hypothetical protein